MTNEITRKCKYKCKRRPRGDHINAQRAGPAPDCFLASGMRMDVSLRSFAEQTGIGNLRDVIVIAIYLALRN